MTLFRQNFAADTIIADMVYLSGFLAGESVEVILVASDGTTASLGTADADDGGMGAVELRHSGLSEGQYSVAAFGDGGGKASATFIVK